MEGWVERGAGRVEEWGEYREGRVLGRILILTENI